MLSSRSFASDNNSGVHPDVFCAMQAANQDHTIGYGDDPYTCRALELFRLHLGQEVEVFFVYGGTGANVLGLSALVRPYEAVVCAETAHINVDECGAPEKYSGSKLLALPAPDGKLNLAALQDLLAAPYDLHHVQPRVISITQPTELGALYTLNEIREIAALAHEKGLLLHMDGARVFNAAAAMNLPLAAFTGQAGVDVLSFGGTKNGMMYGEAVVFFRPELSQDFRFIRKQGMQLASKMRFISAQFSALLEGGLGLKNAAHANRMASNLGQRVSQLKGVCLARPVQANAVFAVLERPAIERLLERYFFYWEETACEARWMASFDTSEEDIEDFVRALEEALRS